jgi:ankyrin repeat protein
MADYNMETLIEKAGDGDIAAVGELISSNIKPNIACGVAASRGGHYDVLSILLASGLNADPDPSKHNETPMLVAIGRGYLKIVHLLLEQDNFNPTRRNREGKTYWQISEERKGPKWQQEWDMLKSAYRYYQEDQKGKRLSMTRSGKKIKIKLLHDGGICGGEPSESQIESTPVSPAWEIDDEVQSVAPVTQGENLAVALPPSDSGYGTASHCSRKIPGASTLPNAHQADGAYTYIQTQEDAATEYSDTMSMSEPRRNGYVSGLAEDLATRLQLKVEDNQVLETLLTRLPRLLQVLALHVGYEATSQMHRDVMVFVHKHRK